jgi:glycerophosphoryl diester phosphodiesterase
MDRGLRSFRGLHFDVRPVRIAHRGGNDRALLRRALAAGVDWIESDIWFHYGRLVARHDPALWRTPIRYSRTSVSISLTPALDLDTLLTATNGTSTRVLIDLKGDDLGLPSAIVDLIRRRGAFDRTALCTQEWRPLEEARHLDDRITIVFSLGRPEHVSAYLARRRDGTAPPTASCRHELLTPTTIARLKEAGSTVLAWTVDSEARARQLLAWGVDGITSNRFEMLNRLTAPCTGNA